MTIGERLRSRVLGLDQRWIDLALAGTVAVWFTIELLTRDPQGTDRVATAATGLLVIAALVVRTPHLAVACCVFAAAVLVQEPLDGGLMVYMDSSFAALFALAQAARGSTAPSPNVGCVIVSKGGRIVGRGATAPGGRPHAEAMALAEAGSKARGADVYVTLEPCAHDSERGPACTDLLIAAKPARVIAAASSGSKT